MSSYFASVKSLRSRPSYVNLPWFGPTMILTPKSNDVELIIKHLKIKKCGLHSDYGWSRSGRHKTPPPIAWDAFERVRYCTAGRVNNWMYSESQLLATFNSYLFDTMDFKPPPPMGLRMEESVVHTLSKNFSKIWNIV